MKIFTLILLAAAPSFIWAQAPKRTSEEVYDYLAERSPFTANREAVAPLTGNNPAANLAITGFTRFPSGYFIIITDRKAPNETFIIQPGSTSAVELIEVNDEETNVTAKIRYQGHEATIAFDHSLAKIKAPLPADKPALTIPQTTPQR